MSLPAGALPSPEPTDGRRGARVNARTLVAGGVGILLLVLLLWHAGVEAVWGRLRLVGWWAPVLLLPYAVIALTDAFTWRCALPAAARRRVPFSFLYLTRMAGEAVNSMTPTASVGGEPVKVLLLRRFGVSAPDGFASIVIAKTALTAAQSFFTAIGVAAILDYFGRRALALGWLATLIVSSAGFTVLLVWMQRRNPASMVWRGLRRLLPRAAFLARWEPSVQALDQRLADFYHLEHHAFLRATLWSFSGWMLGVVEVHLMLGLTGHPVSWQTAFIIESLSQPIRAAAIVVPGGIGTQEVGGVWLCGLLGIPEAEAVTLWLLKRARELAFDGVGLLYLARVMATRGPSTPRR